MVIFVVSSRFSRESTTEAQQIGPIFDATLLWKNAIDVGSMMGRLFSGLIGKRCSQATALSSGLAT